MTAVIIENDYVMTGKLACGKATFYLCAENFFTDQNAGAR
jgi:hypothetical protein